MGPGQGEQCQRQREQSGGRKGSKRDGPQAPGTGEIGRKRNWESSAEDRVQEQARAAWLGAEVSRPEDR